MADFAPSQVTDEISKYLQLLDLNPQMMFRVKVGTIVVFLYMCVVVLKQHKRLLNA